MPDQTPVMTATRPWVFWSFMVSPWARTWDAVAQLSVSAPGCARTAPCGRLCRSGVVAGPVPGLGQSVDPWPAESLLDAVLAAMRVVQTRRGHQQAREEA